MISRHTLTHGDAWDTAIIGGGVIGAAIAFGLQELGQRVIVLDGADDDLRASTGAFGLLWVQDKGVECPAYGQWARASASGWGPFADRLYRVMPQDTGYRRNGGLHICLSDQELTTRIGRLEQLKAHSNEVSYTVLDRDSLARKAGLKPGPLVVGAIYCPLDGAVRPLAVLGALRAAVSEQGRLQSGVAVENLIPQASGGWRLNTSKGQVSAQRVVITAGLDSQRLAAPFGLALPMRPVRGQLLVTEAVDPVFNIPAFGLMQMPDGRFVIGNVYEDAGLDDGDTISTMARLSAHATALFPSLAGLRVIAAKAGVRTLPPDRMPLYGESPSHPGLFACAGHGGLLLAAIHANTVAPWIAGLGPPPPPELNCNRFGAPC